MPQTRHPPANPKLSLNILQNTFSPIGSRTAHRPLCHEYLAPDRTTFSGLSPFYTVLWHITLKAIRKITEFLTCLKHATFRPTLSIPFQNHLVRLIPTLTGQTHIVAGFVRRFKCFHGQTHIVAGFVRRYKCFHGQTHIVAGLSGDTSVSTDKLISLPVLYG